jgi:2-polyprenyl-3-methyl-5-hydroxy-6-metoxy-1,4-benzoquinol methylase
MAQFHFVEDYEKLVASLMAAYPIDEAMSRLAGGNYELFGLIEAAILRTAGLEDGMRLVDLGCGGGRLASALHGSADISFVGIDIVQALLDYAKTKAPKYQFLLHRGLSIPQEGNSADFVSAFSVFTHLLQAETYIYLEECVRVLRPGGKIVFSFLEFAEPKHWDVFAHTRRQALEGKGDHLNMFIERGAIDVWAAMLGIVVERYISASTPTFNGHALGQSVAVLRKPVPNCAANDS